LKYWRGYLVAAITAVCAWALSQFAAAHSTLVDMLYPYMTRMVLGSLADWSAGVDFCLWQAIFLLFVALVLMSVILMILLRWNPIQWFGWVLAVVSVVFLLNTGLHSLNIHAGSIAEDVKLEVTEHTVTALEDAATYYRDQAKALAVSKTADFATLAQQAGEGFEKLTYDSLYPVFAGSTVPVKELSWAGLYNGVTGKLFPLTGEAAVNPNVPQGGLPYAMCVEMARRMSIAKECDANFAAFLACNANSNPQFRYSGFLMAYRACVNALQAVDSPAGKSALLRLENGLISQMKQDLQSYNDFLGKKAAVADEELTNLLVSWHIQTVVLPSQTTEPEDLFDPYDETDELIQGILNERK